MKIRKLLPITIILLLLTLSMTQLAIANAPVNIPDPNLRAAIENALGKAQGARITPADMRKLKKFFASGDDIQDLTGIEAATNLKQLGFQNNRISDVSPLAGLKKLQYLNLAHNQLSDISSLADLQFLRRLILSNNRISDVSPLASLEKLKELVLDHNQISDFSPIAGLIPNLVTYRNAEQTPKLNDNELVNIPDPALRAAVDKVNIPDPNLRRVIAKTLNKPVDGRLTQEDMKRLGELRVLRQPIRNLTGLEFAINLKSLVLRINGIRDVSPLANLINLEKLVLADNAITDVSPLENLRNLTTLNLTGNPITDVSPLVGLRDGGTEIMGVTFTTTYDDEFLSSVGMWCATPDPDAPLSIPTVLPDISTVLRAVGKPGELLEAAGIKAYFWWAEDSVAPSDSDDDGVVVTVRFMNGTPLQKARVKKFVPQWAQYAELRFIFIEDDRPSDIRVWFERRGFRSKSYVGTGANYFKGQPTLWLGAGYGKKNPQDPLDADPDLPPSGTILHEFGHALGLLHEQTNPSATIRDVFDMDLLREIVTDQKKRRGLTGKALNDAVDEELCRNYSMLVTQELCNQYNIDVFDRDEWTRTNYTEFDPESIMLYPGLPLKTGAKTAANYQLSQTDKGFIGSLYPKEGTINKIEVRVNGKDATQTSPVLSPVSSSIVKVVTGSRHTIVVTIRDRGDRVLSNVPVSISADGDAPIIFDQNVINTGPTGIGATILFRSTGWNQNARLQVKAGDLTQNVSIYVTQPPPKRLEVTLKSSKNPSSYRVTSRDQVPISVRVFGEGHSRPLSNVLVSLSSSGSASITFSLASLNLGSRASLNTGPNGTSATATVTFKGVNASGSLKVRAEGLSHNVSIYVDGRNVVQDTNLSVSFTFYSGKGAILECAFGGRDRNWTSTDSFDFTRICRGTVVESSIKTTTVYASHAADLTGEKHILAKNSNYVWWSGKTVYMRAKMLEHCDNRKKLTMNVKAICRNKKIVGAPALTDVLSTLWQELSEVPAETALLLNYPNPFNPETWIPYHLAEPADVTLSIYAADGKLVRTLALGYQSAGVYESKSRAAYWDGRNAFGERVASGLYLYTFTAGEFTATGRMLILK